MARALVRGRLAACVTVVPGAASHYRWKKKFERTRETLMLIKTSRRCWPKLLDFLKKNHPYEVPEALMLPVSKGSADYLSWLDACLRE